MYWTNLGRWKILRNLAWIAAVRGYPSKNLLRAYGLIFCAKTKPSGLASFLLQHEVWFTPWDSCDFSTGTRVRPISPLSTRSGMDFAVSSVEEEPGCHLQRGWCVGWCFVDSWSQWTAQAFGTSICEKWEFSWPWKITPILTLMKKTRDVKLAYWAQTMSTCGCVKPTIAAPDPLLTYEHTLFSSSAWFGRTKNPWKWKALLAPTLTKLLQSQLNSIADFFFPQFTHEAKDFLAQK